MPGSKTCLDYAVMSNYDSNMCYHVSRIRFLTGNRTLLIMSLIILSVIIYCVFFLFKNEKKEKMNAKN